MDSGRRYGPETGDVGGPSPIDVELLNKYKSYEIIYYEHILKIETMIRDKD